MVKERLYKQLFSDEVCAFEGAHTHTQLYITVKEGRSDRYDAENL